MSERFPPHQEISFSKSYQDESSALLEELARIRQDIVQDSMPSCRLKDKGMEKHGSSNNTCDEIRIDDKLLSQNTFQRSYRFDLEHGERSVFAEEQLTARKNNFHSNPNDTEPDFPRYDFGNLFQAEWEHRPQAHTRKPVVPPTKPLRSAEIKQPAERNFVEQRDEVPDVIPFHRTEVPKSKPVVSEPVKRNRNPISNIAQPIADSGFADLPWRVISRYENETFVKMTDKASNLSLLIGWGAIACGVMVFIRSFVVGSTIWLHYGLPIIAIGAACLFLGIILSILSEKMQHINDLKQSMTAHRILHPATKTSDSPLPECAVNTSAPAKSNESDVLKDVHDRLLKLQSEIHELIEECENAAVTA